MEYGLEDTIVAIATPMGLGAIGIVRMSGSRAIEIVNSIIEKDQLGGWKELECHKVRHARLVVEGECLDDVLILTMKMPRSYTGEDTIEIQCHGSPLIMSNIVNACVRKGARIAEAGEFTKRAFLNGKMDLAQAESVVDLISASSDRALTQAMRVLKGELREKIMGLKGALFSILADQEAETEFPDEELGHGADKDVIAELEKCAFECRKLTESHKAGIIAKEGIRVVLVGKQNVGKSSIFNKIVEKDKAIVTYYPGTTRDIVEESVSINGVEVTVVDTAGLSDKESDLPSMEAVKKSISEIMTSEIVVFVVDQSAEWSNEDEHAAFQTGGRKGIFVYNKADLEVKMKHDDVAISLREWPYVRISALTGLGIKDLKNMIAMKCMERIAYDPENSLIVTNVRHADALRRCEEEIGSAVDSMQKGYTGEITSLELRRAIDALDEVSGEKIKEDLLDSIFSRFCIGK